MNSHENIAISKVTIKDKTIKKLFDSLDKDRDGFVELKDIIRLVNQANTNKTEDQKSDDSDASISCLMRKYGTYDRLNFDEFQKMYEDCFQSYQKTEKYRRIFNFFDRDRSGLISVSDLTKMLKKMQIQVDVKSLTHFVSKYDNNGDKLISFEEFMNLWTVQSEV